MNNYNMFPENDYRNYLMHWGKGKQAKEHKYISREKGKNGKWIYTYASNLKNKAKETIDKFTNKNVEPALEGTSEVENRRVGNFLDLLNSLTTKKEPTSTKQSKLSVLKSKISQTLKKPISSVEHKRSLKSIMGSISKSTRKRVSDALKKPISSIKSSVAGKSLKKLNSKISGALSTSTKALKSSKFISKLQGKSKSKKISGNPNDPRPAGDSSMDHSKSDKSELRSYLLGLGVHYATMNYPALERDAIRAARSLEAPVRKKLVEDKRNKSAIDPETGLHLKNSESSKIMDMGMVNPEYKNFDANTKNNCMLCTTAYDLRRRGYEVSANKASTGYSPEDCTRWYKGGKVETIAVTEGLDARSIDKYADETIDYLKKQGNGARGNLMVTWTTGGGHSVAYEIEDGNVVIYDCQTNKIYKDPKRVLRKTIGAQCMRLDNLEVDHKYVKEAVR